MGPAAWIEKKGTCTEIGNRNREIGSLNKELRMVNARLRKLQKWLYSQPLEDAPVMNDIMDSIFVNRELKNRAQRIADIKTYANALIFLEENNLSSIEDLADTLDGMQQRQYDISGSIKKLDHRMSSLEKHISAAEIHKATASIYSKYISLAPKNQAAYKAKHAEAVKSYETSQEYLKRVLNGRTSIPTKTWKKEREKLLWERYALAEQYYDLKDDVRNAEVLRRGVERIMDEIEPTQLKTQIHEIEL